MITKWGEAWGRVDVCASKSSGEWASGRLNLIIQLDMPFKDSIGYD